MFYMDVNAYFMLRNVVPKSKSKQINQCQLSNSQVTTTGHQPERKQNHKPWRRVNNVVWAINKQQNNKLQ
jgi:hypothetical protein